MVMNKVALTLVLFAVYLLIVGAVTGLAWLCLVGMLIGLAGVVIFALTDAPLIETDAPSRLDRLDGVTEWDRDEGARAEFIDDYLDGDLSRMTIEQLEAEARELLTTARTLLEGPDWNEPSTRLALDAAMERHAEVGVELDRRLTELRKSTGWTWPKEVA